MSTEVRAEPRTCLLGGETAPRTLFRGLTWPVGAVLGGYALACLVARFLLLSSPLWLLPEVAVGVGLWLGLTRRSADGSTSWAAARLERTAFGRRRQRRGALSFTPTAAAPAPPELGRVTALAYAPPGRPNAPMALLWHRPDRQAGHYTVCLEVAGGGDGLRDVAETNRAGKRFGSLLYALSTSAYLTDEVQLLTRTVPIDADSYSSWLAAHLAARCPDLLARSQRELAAMAAHTAEQHRSYLVLRMTREAVADRARERGLPGDDGRHTVVFAEVRAAADLAARAGLGVRAVLGPQRLASLVRSTYCPDYGVDDLGADLASCWPAYTAGPRSVAVGGWHHATASVPKDGWPTGPVGLRMLDPLVAGIPGVVRTVSVGVGLDPRQAARRQARTHHTADRQARLSEARKGATPDGTTDAQASASAQRLHDLTYDEAAGARPAVRVLVSARTPGLLAAARDRADTAAQDAGLLRLAWHDGRHHHGLLTVLPLARGVRR